MAISSLDVPCNKPITKYPASTNSSCLGAGLSSCKLVKINFATEGSIISSTGSKRSRKNNTNSKSPYLGGDNIHLHSQVTEKTIIHKKATAEYVSSYPMAVNLYKASSDEFKRLKKANKKAKKSVLTLPNEAPTLQACTVSDMNDSEYFNEIDSRKKIKKRNVPPRTRKSRISRDFEFYDRDARYCSQMNINLDCSSTDIIHNKRGNENFNAVSNPNEKKPSPHDVWEVLRNINRFQFNPSPPMSDQSFKAPKRKGTKRQNNQKDTRVVETCRTEEFAYISSYEIGSSHSLSRSSSFSIETVIDTQEDISKFCDEFEKRIIQTKQLPRTTNKSQIRNPNNKAVINRNTSKPFAKDFTPKTNKQKRLPIEYTKKHNYNCGDTKQNGVQENVVGNFIYNKVNDEFTNESFYNKVYETQLPKEIDDDVLSENNFTFTVNSGTSKVAFNDEFTKSGVSASSEFDTICSTQINNPLNGITKVVLSKGPSKPAKIVENTKPIRQKVSFPPNQPSKFNFSTLIPKLTQTEIKRRLAKLKFPIVILGKDELGSSYEVSNTESIQFNGLNDKVWPFMEGWQNDESVQQTKVKTKTDFPMKKKHYPDIVENNRTQKLHKKLIPVTQPSTDRKTNVLKGTTKCKEEQKHIASPAELLNSVQPKKTKPIRQFKEKMLKLLYKKSSILSIDNKKENTGEYSTINTSHLNKTTVKVDACTDTCKPKSPQGAQRSPINSPAPVPKQVLAAKQPWAKARWASDFIDNVIKKIKNGVYYTQDSKLSNKKQYLDCKEAEIQTIATQSEPITMESISKITVKKKEVIIPGFDNNTLPALEIHAMNMNQISVKHCVTNIMVHFDVTVPNEPVISLNKSPSFIPLKVSESQSKTFKCKTSIINAMLPAELCSILPNLWNVLESGRVRALPPAPFAKPIQLTNIEEISNCKIPKLYRPLALCLQITMTPELQKIINGMFSETRLPHVPKKFVEIKFNRIQAEELLSRQSIHNLFDCKAEIFDIINYKSICAHNLSKPVEIDSNKLLDSCMTLEPYTASNRSLIPSFMWNDLPSVLRRMRSYLTEDLSSCSRVFNYLFDKNITINLTTTNSQGLKDTLSIDLSRFVNANCVNVLDISKNKLNFVDNKDLPKLQHDKLKAQSNMNLFSSSAVHNKTKKKGFVKLYRKCKSTSNIISGEKTTTSISKITNLDEFFQALGTAKLLCGVFDNAFAHKILTSLKEMRCWISDINPTQALLVFLLMNKKETANLLRYKPVLLQGIAVSRITRANELDMEIEVIEKENLNRFNQHEGISSLSGSAEEQDILLEELCWIAKTTASDYQRTFDASSEKLLKSLLEKRKKLNPSYLRVMARYVGLGLLKTPVKK